MTSETSRPHIRLDEVDVVRNGVTILFRVSLEIHRKEILSVVGRNGSGKTTLLELLARRLEPERGCYSLDSQDDGSQLSIFYAPQAPHRALLPHSHAFDNISLAALVRGEPRQRRLERARKALQVLGLSDPSFLAIRAKFLSGGEQQFVLAARLLAELEDPMVRPEVVLLDEVFSALDVHARLHTALTVRASLRNAGVTSVVVSHDLDEATILADRIVVLGRKPGQILATIDVPMPEPRNDLSSLAETSALAAKQRVVEVLASANCAASEFSDAIY